MEKFVHKRPPPYEVFFAPLEAHLSPTKLERIQFAYFLSKYGHALQKRDDGTRFFDHPKSVAWSAMTEYDFLDPEVIILCLLHDTKEDTYLLSLFRIALNFGVRMALDIRAVTKLKKGKETTEEYLARIIARGPKAIFAKLLDRLHNLRELGNCEPEKIARQLEETRKYHLQLLSPALRTHGDKWSAIADKTEQKILEAMGHFA